MKLSRGMRNPARNKLSAVTTILVLLSTACMQTLRGPGPISLLTNASPPLSAADSVHLIAQLSERADYFVRQWRYYWEVSEFYRSAMTGGRNPMSVASNTWTPPDGTSRLTLSKREQEAVGTIARRIAPLNSRTALIHCHPDGGRGDVLRYFIMSTEHPRAVCPDWYPTGATPPWDERRGIDGALVEMLKPRTSVARAALLDKLERAAKLLPGDSWIAGQRVRFAVDQHDTAAVRRAVNDCHAERWWCLALTGFALHQSGQLLRSDSVFQNVIALMPSEDRCRWTDITTLLDDDDRLQYTQIPCDDRDLLNARFWWLADPVYSDRGNDRRAEHYSRRVVAILRSANTFHERWDWRPEGGGTAVTEMILRYGWPSYSYWGGRAVDIEHYRYLVIMGGKWYDHGRFATAEYAGERFRFLPRLPAATTPSQSMDSDWVLSSAVQKFLFPRDSIWWPREHYDRIEGPIVQLWSQHGLFRRQDTVLFAMATTLPSSDFSSTRDTLRGNLYFGNSEVSMRAERARGIVGSVNILKSLVMSRPQIASLELHGTKPAGVVARTRFGIEPPLPLAALKAGEIAIAPPVLIQPTLREELAGDNPESALMRMLPSVGLRGMQTVGLYWETYGLGARDSVVMSVRVERNEPRPGLFRRLGFAIGLADRERGNATNTWSEAQPLASMNVVSGSVPIQGRVLTLNISQLQSGDYTLIVSASRPGGTAVSATRDFAIVR